MTTYERFKAGVLVCLGLFLLELGVLSWRATDALTASSARLSSTLATSAQSSLTKFNATLASLDGVGPQAVSTLKTLQSAVPNVSPLVMKAGSVLDQTTVALEGVNRLCGVPGKPCGTLADVNRTLATVRGTFGQIEVAAKHEDRNLDDYDAQEKRLADDIHTTSANLNAVIASPDIARFLKASADTSVQVAGIATDVHKEADALTAPKPWYTKLGAYGTTAVNVACLVTHSCPF